MRINCDRPSSQTVKLVRLHTVGYLAEAVIVLLLFTALVAQLMTYPPTYADDPDGYVTYAKYLREHHALMIKFPRLPGYPLFLAAVMSFPTPR